jgi:threonine/homoserine/homoserine lactone efflux protein
MEATLPPAGLIALFAAMVVLAALPSVSTLTVITRAAGLGWRHGVATALGIVLADLLFILLAVGGLGLVATRFAPAWTVLRLGGAAYLAWMAWRLWRANTAPVSPPPRATWGSSVAVGLMLTLGDQKAILFYLAFLPAFVDLANLSAGQVGAIAGITVLAVGGTKTVFALLADRLARRFSGYGGRGLTRLAALVMLGAAVLLVGQVLGDG